MKTIEILKDEEIIRSIDCVDEQSQNLLKRAKLDATVMTRDLDGNYIARIKNEEVIIPD
jgi:aspartokinase-like uncharacterized kinase